MMANENAALRASCSAPRFLFGTNLQFRINKKGMEVNEN